MRSFLLRLEGYFKRMPERDQKIFPYFLFICIFIIFYYGLIQPTKQKTVNLKNENLDLEQKVFMLKSKVSVLDTVKAGMAKKEKEFDSLQKEFENLKKRVPDADEVSGIIKTLAKAEKVDYLIREVDEENYIKHKEYVEIPINVNLSGDFYNVYHFLKQLENSKRFLVLNGMTLNANADKNGNVDASVEMSAFKIMDLNYYINLYARKGKEKENEKKKSNN